MSYISDSLTPEKLTLPLIPLGGVAAFPAVPLNFEVGDAPSISAARSANATDSFVMLLSLTRPTEGDYKEEDFYRVGTIAKIKQAVQTPEGHTRLLCEGYARAELVTLHRLADHYVADVLCYLKGLRRKNLVGGAFGSYGWNPAPVNALAEWLKAAQVELAAPVVSSKFVPTEEVLENCRQLGLTIAQKITEKTK